MARIPLAVPDLTGNERKYLNECIDTTFVSSVGAFVTRLESMTAEATGASYASATSSGTTALHMALLAAGVLTGNIVIIPSFTFIATANAVSHCGALPWCIDIDESSWTMSPDVLYRELKENTEFKNGMTVHKPTGRRVAGIMPVYTFGNVADMDKINEIARQFRLPVIADAAAAIGARYRGKELADIADISAISFNGNKTVTAGGGGMAVSNNKEYIDYIHHIASTSRIGPEYNHDMIGYNYRLTNLQAAVGCAQLERVKELVDKKRYIRKYYKDSLKEFSRIKMFPEPAWGESACWFSGIYIPNGNAKMVKEICESLGERDIEARSFWKPVHMQKPYSNCFCSEMGVTETIWNRIVTLPCSTGITQEELEQVTEALKDILKGCNG